MELGAEVRHPFSLLNETNHFLLLFLRKAMKNYDANEAGLLAYFWYRLPSRFKQWHENQYVNEAYSSGDCSGFSPDSLLKQSQIGGSLPYCMAKINIISGTEAAPHPLIAQRRIE